MGVWLCTKKRSLISSRSISHGQVSELSALSSMLHSLSTVPVNGVGDLQMFRTSPTACLRDNNDHKVSNNRGKKYSTQHASFFTVGTFGCYKAKP